MCIFANEGGPKSKSSRKETPLKIQKYKEIHVSGKNLEKKMFSGMLAPTPNVQGPTFRLKMLVLKFKSLFVMCKPLLWQFYYSSMEEEFHRSVYSETSDVCRL